ncbi:terminase TerL endonuclease subunit [Glaciihabitans sp. UYNi722]|uniref:terminase large subunit n=1 Tax=Glaciihabitans sp. UYNi722 TaxID=3156344 RepID=UPI00339B0450
MESRGIPFSDCPPRIKTPEPRNVKGAKFSFERVDKVLAAFRALKHVSGQWSGQPLIPDPWQVEILAPVFGWVIWDDDADMYVRIIRKLYVDVPRKNGKSTLLGGLAIYMLAADGEPGAQIVTAATSERQAGFVFNPIKTLADKSPALKKHVRTVGKKVLHPKSGSYIEVVSSVADAQHGANLHFVCVDELHVHKTPDLVETLETGTGSRRQPLIGIITTADSGKQNTIYARKREYIEQLARGAIKDPSSYGVVWAAEAGSDPFVEATWKSANPGYGISPTRAYMKSAAAEAQQSPADLAKFQRLHLGLRTKQETKYLDLEVWDRNGSMVDESKLAGKQAYGGLDLASTSDLCALAWTFPDGDGGFDALWRLWTPEANLAALDKRTAGMATVWVREGFLTLTPGNVADYDYIQMQINKDRESFDVRGIAYDPWNSSQLVNDLVADGAPMVKTRQGLVTLSAPTKELQRILLLGTNEKPMFRHGGNPAVRWQADNFTVAMDAAGNVKPDKGSAPEKIDAIAATVNSMSLVLGMEPNKRSKYEDDNLLVIGGYSSGAS